MLKSISTKMIAAMVMLVVLCASAFLILNMNEHESIYKRTVVNHLDALASNLADDLLALFSDTPDTLAMSTKLLDFDEYDNVKYSLIYDSEWNEIQRYVSVKFMEQTKGTVQLPPFNIKNVSLGVSIEEGDLIALKPIGDRAFAQGYLLVVNDYSEPLGRSNYSLFKSSLPVALFILILMTFIAVVLNRRLFAPLRRLAKFTQSIETSTNYHLRFDTQGDDEVSELGTNINAMLERIEHQNKTVMEHTHELEDHKHALEKLANYDPLTNLPNRKFFIECLRSELARTRRRFSNLIVMFLDLDDFKRINDSLGHETGDALLAKVSGVIAQQLREGDILGRLGGDEFLILLCDINTELMDSAIIVAERIIRALSLPVFVKDWEVHTGVSIGIADAISSSYDAETIIRNADIAMYDAKASGRNTYSMFQQQLQAESMRKMLIANALSKGLAEDEFWLAYQPKVGAKERVNGYEALIRWESKFDGFVSPGEFIPVAESSGKINMLTRWVIQRVFEDLPALINMSSEEIKVSLNLSAHDIKDEMLIEFVQAKIKEYSVNPRNVEFEITESAYLDNFDDATDFLEEVRAMGFSIALDDFGTGYSSLSYLTQLQLDTLKIDQQFVRRITNSSKDKLIIEAIIALAHKMDLNVCAEGVESAMEMEYLFELGCQQLQGYYYAKPSSIYELPNITKRLGCSVGSDPFFGTSSLSNPN